MKEANEVNDETITNYKVEVRKTKGNAKCRLCRKNIYQGQIGVRTEKYDGFKSHSMFCHVDCFLSFIIKNMKQLEIEELQNHYNKFKKIDDILNPKRKKEGEAKK